MKETYIWPCVNCCNLMIKKDLFQSKMCCDTNCKKIISANIEKGFNPDIVYNKIRPSTFQFKK